MPRLLVNTTFSIAADTLDSFMEWITSGYIPAIEHTDGCAAPLLLRVALDSAENPDATYALQFQTASPEVAVRWLETSHRSLLAAFFAKHTPEQLPMFTTVMEIVE